MVLLARVSKERAARDAGGDLRLVDIGALPFPSEVFAFDRECLEHTAKTNGKVYGPDLAIDSVYELCEDIGK